MATRSPIVSVLGHVDHGKSSILDSIRGSNIVGGEAGAITQAIGASIVPLEIIKNKCGKLLESLKFDVTIPGLLFIDTPGHAAFTSLRKRGGTLADIAILVVDVNEGFKPQTEEALEILKSSKTPFIIAANKIDLVPGYTKKKERLLADINAQADNVKQELDQRIYELVGHLHDKFGFIGDRFDRISNYTKQIGIVPTSAKQGIGLEELLMVLTGLAQRYLEESLKIDVSGKAKGTILEVKEEKGLGTTLDVIIYDGTLKVDDTIVIGAIDKPIITKVRALLEPDHLAEMRDKKSKFKKVKKVSAATGVKIVAPGLDRAVAGMPVRVVESGKAEEVSEEIKAEMEEVMIDTDDTGVLVKADTIGSLEAMLKILHEHDIPIQNASVGNISKKDYARVESIYDTDPLYAAILGFNVKDEAKMKIEGIKIITSDVIYRLVEEFQRWQAEKKKEEEVKKLDTIIRPCKVEVLQNCIFRQSNPCIMGVEVMVGKLKIGTPLMKKGASLSAVKSMQLDGDNVQVAEKGDQVAISVPHVTAGRQVEERDILYSDIPEDDFRKLKTMAEFLNGDEIQVLKDIAEVKRKHNPVWGV